MQDTSNEKNIFDISYIQCNNKNPLQLFCINQNCMDGFIICHNAECQCQTKSHKKCNMVEASRFYQNLTKKKGSIGKQFQSTINKIIEIYDEVIDSLSQEREHMENCIKDYGLTVAQIKFIQKIQNNSLDELNKDQFTQVIYNSKLQKKLNVNMIYDELSNGWKKKQKELMSLFKFRDQKYFTVFDRNQFILEQFSKEKIQRHLSFVDKQNIKVLTVRNFSKSDKLHQSAFKLVAQFKNLQKLSIDNFNCRPSVLFETVRQLPRLKQLILEQWEDLKNCVPQIKQIIQLPYIKKFSIIKDIEYPLKKRYQQAQFFGKNINEKDFNTKIQYLPLVLNRLQYWECCGTFGQQEKHLENLKHLILQGTIFSIDKLLIKSIIPKSQNLLSLKIHNCQNIFSKKQTASWQGLPSLKRLIISQCQKFSTQDLALICHYCRHLEHLVLDKVIPKIFNYSAIRKLIKLQTLSLQMNSDQAEDKSDQVYNLKFLFLDDEQQIQNLIDQQLMQESAWLAKLTNLKTLNLKNNIHFQFHWLPNIKKLRSLQFISLNCPKEMVQSMICLRNLTRLQTLILNDQLSQKVLQKILVKTKKLTRLKMSNKMNSEKYGYMVQNLKHLQYLSTKRSSSGSDVINPQFIYQFKRLKYIDVVPQFKQNQVTEIKERGINTTIKKNPKHQFIHRIQSDQENDIGMFGLFD